MNAESLKSCPFCGSEVKLTERYKIEKGIFCIGCHETFFINDNRCITKWNTRHEPKETK